jgi:hypothetical protein
MKKSEIKGGMEVAVMLGRHLPSAESERLAYADRAVVVVTGETRKKKVWHEWHQTTAMVAVTTVELLADSRNSISKLKGHRIVLENRQLLEPWETFGPRQAAYDAKKVADRQSSADADLRMDKFNERIELLGIDCRIKKAGGSLTFVLTEEEFVDILLRLEG